MNFGLILICVTHFKIAAMSSHGGSRPGAGRKSSASPFNEPTVPVRVPVSRKFEVLEFLNIFKLPERTSAISMPDGAMLPTINPAKVSLPLYGTKVRAGFPSPADDYVEDRLDLNELLIKNGPATFFLKVEGCSMIGAGIFEGDIIVVDRSIEPRHRDIVLAIIDGRHTIKRLIHNSGEVRLQTENPDQPDIVLKDGMEMMVVGVVTNSIHPLR